MKWIVYILKCADGTLYTGVTNDLEKRLEKHASGKGAKYTKGRGPYEILYSETHPDRSSALKREIAIKGLTKKTKLELISKETGAKPKKPRSRIRNKISRRG